MSARVLIAGGGIGALAGALALREYAPPGLELTLLAPGPDLVLAPETVLEATGGPPAARYELAAVAADIGAALIPDVLEGVEVDARQARTRTHGELGYDALLLTVGALPGPALPGALRFSGTRDVAAFREALAAAGEDGRVVFAAAPGVGWTLPLYELALLSAERHPGRSIAVATPEPRPAAAFGAVAAREVGRQLAAARIEVHAGVLPESVEEGALWLADGSSLKADLVVALAQPVGPAIPGLPSDAYGFVPVDRYGRVRNAPAVWAAGDATARPLKQGGLAAQQAEVAARSLAAALGAHVTPEPYRPALRAVLLSDKAPRYLRHSAVSSVPSVASVRPLWSAPGKVADGRVARYLASHQSLRV